MCELPVLVVSHNIAASRQSSDAIAVHFSYHCGFRAAMPVPGLTIDYSTVTLYDADIRYVARKFETAVPDASRHFPAVVITGARLAGNTTLLPPFFLQVPCVPLGA